MNILITGGAGFIGTHLYNHLKDEHNVTRIDNFKTSEEVKDVIDMDLSNLSEHEEVVLDYLVSMSDVVYHFASSIGVALINSDPSGTLMNSFKINNTLFPMFDKHKPKVIYASSSEVYGSSSTPMKESDNLVIGSPQESMRWGYASQKLMSEFLIKSYSFPHTIVRFFNVTGSGQSYKYGMVLPQFINRAIQGKKIEVFGSGEQIRSFCDVRDAVNVLELLITEMNGEILNIGNDDNTFTMTELAKAVKRLSKTDSQIVKEESKRKGYEIETRIPNIDKMKTIYTPRYTLGDIIESMLQTEGQRLSSSLQS